MKKYRGIVIGAGAIGSLLEAEPNRPKPATHAGALSYTEATELVAIVDTDEEKLAQAGALFPSAKRYTSLSEALEVEKPDIACIATNAQSHLEIIRELCAHTVPILISEKPLARNKEEAEEITRLVKDSGATFVLNYQRRFFSQFAKVKEQITNGELGRIQNVTCYYSNGLYNNGGHTVDALQYLLDDEVVAVSGLATDKGVAPPEDSNIYVHLEFSKGTRAVLIPLDQSEYGIHEFHIHGTKGLVSITDYGYTKTFVPKAPSVFAQVEQLDYVHASSQKREESMVLGALLEAVECHESGREPVSGISNGLRDMAILDAIAKSSTEKGIRISI